MTCSPRAAISSFVRSKKWNEGERFKSWYSKAEQWKYTYNSPYARDTVWHVTKHAESVHQKEADQLLQSSWSCIGNVWRAHRDGCAVLYLWQLSSKKLPVPSMSGFIFNLLTQAFWHMQKKSPKIEDSSITMRTTYVKTKIGCFFWFFVFPLWTKIACYIFRGLFSSPIHP